jgi:hypothetical protein
MPSPHPESCALDPTWKGLHLMRGRFGIGLDSSSAAGPPSGYCMR